MGVGEVLENLQSVTLVTEVDAADEAGLGCAIAKYIGSMDALVAELAWIRGRHAAHHQFLQPKRADNAAHHQTAASSGELGASQTKARRATRRATSRICDASDDDRVVERSSKFLTDLLGELGTSPAQKTAGDGVGDTACELDENDGHRRERLDSFRTRYQRRLDDHALAFFTNMQADLQSSLGTHPADIAVCGRVGDTACELDQNDGHHRERLGSFRTRYQSTASGRSCVGVLHQHASWPAK